MVNAKAKTHREDGQQIAVCLFSPLHPIRDSSFQPFTLPRTYKDDEGQKQQPGLKDLPQWLRETFRNLFIRRVIEQACLSGSPWTNPGLSSLQREFNHAYPTHRIRLHSDDAAVIPVSIDRHCYALPVYSQTHTQTLRDLGVLRNQIGSEGLSAVIAFVPRQYTRRMLRATEARAKYIATVLADPQRPFVWEFFRPGTIPLAGERAYYDEVQLIT